jgi:hypothetical protein
MKKVAVSPAGRRGAVHEKQEQYEQRVIAAGSGRTSAFRIKIRPSTGFLWSILV